MQSYLFLSLHIVITITNLIEILSISLYSIIQWFNDTREMFSCLWKVSIIMQRSRVSSALHIRPGVIFRNYVSLTVSWNPRGSIRGMGVREGSPISSRVIGRFCRGVGNTCETRQSLTFDHPSADDATISPYVSSFSQIPATLLPRDTIGPCVCDVPGRVFIATRIDSIS